MPKIDWDHLRASLDRNAEHLASLLRSAPDRSQKVAGLDWTVAQLGAHLVTEPRRFERFGRGENAPVPGGDVARFNAIELEAVGSSDPVKLADLFLEEHAKYAKLAAEHAGDEPYVWFDVPTTWAEATGIYMGELLVHGVDLSRTLRRSWSIDPVDARHVAYGLVPILPGFVDTKAAAGFNGTYELKLRGGGSITLTFENGVLRTDVERKPDCKISADPVAFLLVGYGRASQWGKILSGKIMAGGRKPWLGLKFNSLLVNP